LAEDQHPVGEFGAGGEHEPLGVGVRTWVAGGDLEDLDARVSADPLDPLLPLDDPFTEPSQVGTCGDEQCGLQRLPRPLVPCAAGIAPKRHTRPFR
jgi:hypothetical protein